MCGLAGVLYRDAIRPEDSVLRSMAGALAHRGPDAEGVWASEHVGLGHRRLSIIDLAGGDQPIANEDGSIRVVFNGEIYNYRELKTSLEAKGHRFATNSDTEVLVHLYEEHGEHLVERLRGMFAFALWDSKQKRLLLGRDRVGQKPLYVYRDGQKLLCGSELKAILAHPNVDTSIDPRAVDLYLTYGFIPGEWSIYSKVRKLPAACTLTVTPEDFAWKPRRYWSLDLTPDRELSEGEWRDAVREKVRETVLSHLIADVPVGAFLSGGIDSSLIVAVMAKETGESPQTFSIGFEDERFSELPYARAVAERFGTVHTERFVTAEAAGSLDDLVTYYDEPFADSSAIPTLAVSRLAAERMKVVLSGDGGDEAFGGYSRYLHDLREAAIRRRLPRWFRARVFAPLGTAWPKADRLPRPLRLKTAFQNLSLSDGAAYANTLSIFRSPMRSMLLSKEVRAAVDGGSSEAIAAALYNAPNGDALRGMIGVDTALLLPDDFLTKVDRASMACGLEVRPPLVDHELLELCGRIPSRLKVRGSETKWILKRAFSDLLPPEITNRKKQGFEIPVDAWLRGPLRGVFEDTVLSTSARATEVIDQRQVETLYRAHLGGSGRHGQQLWALLVLGYWMETYRPAGVSA